MALAATANLYCDAGATGAADLNGGAFDPAVASVTKTITDNYCCGASYFRRAYTDLYSNGAALNSLMSDGRAFTDDDVGHAIYLAGVGTNHGTAGWYTITSVAAGVATLDPNYWTAANSTKDGTGTLGGAFRTIGGMGLAHGAVGGQSLWVKYNASAYTATSTSSNVANGRLTLATGTAGAPTVLQGYETTPGDETDNRPTFQWNATSATAAYLITGASTGTLLRNIVLDGHRSDGTHHGRLLSTLTSAWRVKFTSASDQAISTTLCRYFGCEFTDCTATMIPTSTGRNDFYSCYIHDNTAIFVTVSTGTIILIGCVLDTITTYALLQASGAALLTVEGCLFYGIGSYAIEMQAAPAVATIVNNHFENCGAEAIHAAVASGTVRLVNNRFYNNTGGNYGTNIPAGNCAGNVAITDGEPLVDPANGDFRPNKTASRGALMRGAGFPQTFPGLATANHPDIGAFQHADPVLPAITDTKAGVNYGDDGTELQGTYVGGGPQRIMQVGPGGAFPAY